MVWAPQHGYRWRSPLRKFSGSKEHLDWLNDNSQGKLCFTQFSTRIYRNILYCHVIKEYRCLKNAINQLERNEWLFLSAFQQGLQQKLVFVLTQENAFSLRFHFKANRKSIGSFKIGIFKIALHLRDQHAFMWQSLKILNNFNILK